jgi:peroxiredoxin
MKRTLIFLTIAVAAVAIGIYLFMPATQDKQAESLEVPTKILVNQLPDIKLVGIDGSVQYARELNGKNVLVLFNTDCDHCQREAKEIRTHMNAFESYSVWFVASDSFENMRDFAKTYDLINLPNVRFARTEVMEVINNFGAIATPSVYIYSDERQLIKSINGETPIEDIIKYL